MSQFSASSAAMRATAQHSVSPLEPGLERLRSEVIEQLMRRSNDDVALYAASSATTRQGLLAAVGLVIASDVVPLPLGSPVMALVGFGTLHPDWRTGCPPASESLWSQVEFYRTCGWSTPAGCPFDELLEARRCADAHVGLEDDHR